MNPSHDNTTDETDLEIARLKAGLEEAKTGHTDWLVSQANRERGFLRELEEADAKRHDLRAELSRLTEERNQLKVAIDHVSGALCDSGEVVPEDCRSYGEAVRGIVADRQKLRTQLLAEEHARIAIENHGGGPAEDEINRLKNALALVLLFHSGAPWTVESGEQWQAITGSNNATTKGMCDHIRVLLSSGDSE